jgi:hypothetical protein
VSESPLLRPLQVRVRSCVCSSWSIVLKEEFTVSLSFASRILAALLSWLVGLFLVFSSHPAKAQRQDIVPPEKSWYIDDYLSCDFVTKRLLESPYPGDSPQDVWDQYVALLNQYCRGASGALYDTVYAADPCTPIITVSSNGSNPQAFATASGCSVKVQSVPKPTCGSPSSPCKSSEITRNLPAATKRCVAEGWGNGSRFTLTSPPTYGECMCPVGTTYDGARNKCVTYLDQYSGGAQTCPAAGRPIVPLVASKRLEVSLPSLPALPVYYLCPCSTVARPN